MTSGQFRYDPPSSGGGDVRRAAAAVAVQGVYRLVKACLLHSDSNQAVALLVPTAAAAVGDFCAVAGAEAMSLVFAEEGIFVNGQVLRTSREGYETARELGALIHACGVNELTLEKGVRPPELSAFARLLADAQRDRAAAERLVRAELRGARVRSVPSPAGRASAPPELSLLMRAIRAYAASLLVMRAAHADLRASGGAPLDEVRRAAQKLVSLAEEDARPLLSLAVSIDGDPDDAALSVATAVVALAIARQLTTERRSLLALTTAALLYDAGRRRLLRPDPRSVAPPGRPAAPPAERPSTLPLPLDRALDDEEQARLPASAAAALTALGMLHAPSMARTVILYEALALRPDARFSPHPGLRPDKPGYATSGRPPTLLARVLAVARAFTELRASPPLGADARTPLDEILHRLLEHTEGAGAPGVWGATERALVRLLIGALGFLPTGTLVELSTGEIAVVVAAHEHPGSFGAARVRVLYDASGGLLGQPFEVDLAAPAEDAQERAVVRIVDREMARTKALRAAIEPPVASRAVAPRGAPAPPSRRPSSPSALEGRPPSPTPAGRPSSPAIPAARGSTPPAPPARSAAPPTLPPPRVGERVRTAPAPLERHFPVSSPPVAAAWLGRPLTSSSVPAEPPRSAKRPPPIDRAALLEKIRTENLASTQPPPPDAVDVPVVPPPPRLPIESAPPGSSAARASGAAFFSAQAAEPRSRPAPGSIRGAPPPSAPPRTLNPLGVKAGLAQSPPSSRGRRFDPRAEPLDEDTWSDELHTMAPPPPPSTMEPPPAPSTMDPPPELSTAVPPPPPPTLRGSHAPDIPPPPPTWPAAPEPEAGAEEGWPDLDDLPPIEPSPDVTAEATTAAARDRLLAQYLAEIEAAPSSRSGLPSRPPIPREEPPEPPASRGGRAR